MIFVFSIIFTIIGFLGAFIMTIIKSHNFFMALLIGLCVFLIVILFFSILYIVLLVILGNKFSKTYNPKEKWRWRFMNDVSRFSCFWLGVRLHVEGLDKLKKDETYVFYSNHQGFIEIMFFDLVLKDFPRGSMYKIEHQKNPIMSGMVKALGGVPIDRSNDRAAIGSILKIISEVKKGVNFIIYPEGTRSRGPSMNEYHPGSFKVVQKSGAKLAAIAIDGSYKKKVAIPFFPKTIYINIVEVLSNEECNSYQSIDLAKKIHDDVENDIRIARSKYRFLKK